jgi:hypothetical protein
MSIIIVILLLIIVIILFNRNKEQNKEQNKEKTKEYSNQIYNTETFETNNNQNSLLTKDIGEKNNTIRENEMRRNNIVDSILKNNNLNSNEISSDGGTSNDISTSADWQNPMYENIDPNRNKISGVNQKALDALIREVNVGNNIPSNTNRADLFKDKTKSIDASKNYRKVNYKDSNYRMDFNGDGVSEESQNQLDKLYSDALIFHDSEYENNSNFSGMPEDSMGEYATAGITASKPETQKDKIMNMYNSNNYLPNKKYENKDLTKGFQILENPTSVSNPNLIPVLRAMPVSSTLGSKRNASWDLRGDVPNPKTVVAPWNNSSINPDIYSSNRGCL